MFDWKLYLTPFNVGIIAGYCQLHTYRFYIGAETASVISVDLLWNSRFCSGSLAIFN